MIKQIFLPLIGVAVFIVLVGLFMKNSGNLKVLKLNPEQKTLTIGVKAVSIEIAKTTEERTKGLSGRSSLPEDNGMLFVFDHQNSLPAFWMKGMLIPLDIIWINDGKIIKIDKDLAPPKENTPDNKLQTYAPSGPIDYVLEVSGGFSDKNNIKIGDSVTLPTL